MSKYLTFYFNIDDPQAKTYTSVVNNSSTNYVSHSFISVPMIFIMSKLVIK